MSVSVCMSLTVSDVSEYLGMWLCVSVCVHICIWVPGYCPKELMGSKCCQTFEAGPFDIPRDSIEDSYIC